MAKATASKLKKKRKSLDKQDVIVRPGYQPAGKLNNKVALIT